MKKNIKLEVRFISNAKLNLHIKVLLHPHSFDYGINRDSLCFKQAPAAARSVAADVKSAGVMGAASGLAKIIYAKYEPTAKKLHTKYEPMAEQYAASEKRYNVALYLPLVPTEKIAKVFTTQFVAN
ncbi:hypothetical protein R3W88_000333 [Solanum pinnatisectum]|uniref:Uncharacterized protein n=1 Tax=Solanum pinnatisectum TaxID=50273 RepID=A0AAV9MFK7_9SOLN|nr:hypothetical protein R3W88_000333 [Solanum pinnatisectum]